MKDENNFSVHYVNHVAVMTMPKDDFSYLNNITKEDIQDVLSGKRKVVHGDSIQGALSHLRANEGVTGENIVKPQEEKKSHKDYLKIFGNISYEAFKDIQKRSPNVSLEEMNRAGAYLLLRQRPTTLEEMRAQTIHIHVRGSNENKEYEINRHLRMYYPDAKQEEIDKDVEEIARIILGGNKVINTNREISRYLERKKGILENDSKIIEEDYSVYFHQGLNMYIWNFWRGDFDRVKNLDFDSNDKIIIKSEWRSDKTSAEKVVEEKEKSSFYKGRVNVSKNICTIIR